MKRPLGLGVSFLIIVGLVAGYYVYWGYRSTAGRLNRLHQYRQDPEAQIDGVIHAGERCGDAPFIMPTDGLIGFLWGDSFRPGHTHQGLDIFSPDGLGETPVVAVYDGYLTRLPDWRSTVIMRVERDPLQPARQIWLYYTHMADPDGNSFIVDEFPPGTYETFVKAGTVLGYQGNYSADPNNPTGIHLHFSIVEDDGEGNFKNELEYKNTMDPSPYFGMELNADKVGDGVVTCVE
jgi:murein DD-endopeptidase MepM/ murein hydrolase activator NlpD